ncbi:4Fe-4S dicluster domain-containing protein [Telmatospirillum sp.]|uniref:4Fe-4S dicluster domain-containing protein n=1 Tax=Telmatospirillum sp. TaxID=2079197 RepID=UPI0028486299|nr:4Fe-4S dicluster domain-containing protein [Telmatospirillum sp.]MDR3437926.1 4Fe-4S dicluster domain-containing protein [Telmatospirillum sp.]
MRRRAFLHGACGVAAMIVVGAAAAKAKPEEPLLRPPGGQNGKRFDALCLKCNKCIDVCPTKAVGSANFEYGLLDVRTPILNFHLGYCTFCGKCIEACPTAALQDFDPQTERLGLAKVDRESCIAWQWGGCTKCKTACRYQAISLDELGRPVVDAGKCNGCGQCEFVCPIAELRSYQLGQPRAIVVIAPGLPATGRALLKEYEG